MRQSTSTLLDLSRWVAAFLVLVEHVRHIVLLDYGQLGRANIWLKGLYFFSGFGRESVVVFFVLSGFLVGGVTLDRWNQGKVELRRYLIARTSRIYTVLLPALALGFLVDWTGLHHVNLSRLYISADFYPAVSLTSSVVTVLNVPTLLGNIAMLQGIFVAPFGSNGPLWSLSWEWWYYCLFAAVAAAALLTGKARGFAVTAAAGLCVLLPAKILIWGSIWWLGMIAYIFIRHCRWRPNVWVVSVVFCIALTISRLSHAKTVESLLTTYLRDLLVAGAYSLLLLGLADRKPRIPWPSFHKTMADFSYSVYLIHFPITVLAISASYQYLGLPFRVEPTLVSLSYILLLVLCLYTCCYVFARFTERWTPLVREYLEATRLSGSRKVLAVNSEPRGIVMAKSKD